MCFLLFGISCVKIKKKEKKKKEKKKAFSKFVQICPV